MRILSVNIGNTNITFDNCMWSGYEYIYVNGRLVSKKFSWFGVDHVFDVEEDGEWVEYILTTRFDWQGISADIRREGAYVVRRGSTGSYIDIAKPEKRLYLESELV